MRTVIALLIAFSALLPLSCTPPGPDISNPEAMASYLCQRTKDVMDAAKEGNKDLENQILTEMEQLEEKMRNHHQDGFGEFQQKIGESLKSTCKIAAPNFE